LGKGRQEGKGKSLTRVQAGCSEPGGTLDGQGSTGDCFQGVYGMSPTMQRYMRAQTVASGSDLGMDRMTQAVMVISPNHPIVKDLERMVNMDKDSKEREEYTLLMFTVASSMTSG
jgi:HSP90 family molecular chaperone